MAAQAGKQSGFTLLEILVALAVLGLLLAGLSGAVRTTVATWQTQLTHATRQEGLEAAEAVLRDLAARMKPAELSRRTPALVGNATGMSFVSTLPQAAAALPTR